MDSKLKQMFAKKETVYSSDHSEYVQIKNFEEGTQDYLCRFVKSESKELSEKDEVKIH
jgi:hypothetical protein